MLRKLSVIIYLILVMLSCNEAGDENTASNLKGDIKLDGLIEKGKWTIMIYLDADNNLEQYSGYDAEEMLDGYNSGQNYNVVLLVDRSSKYAISSRGFGEVFSGTRMYTLAKKKNGENYFKRISGGSNFPEITTDSYFNANMGDISTLRKFMRSARSQFPAEKYALVLWDHGLGPRGGSSEDGGRDSDYRGICVDESSGNDILYLGEISDGLSSEDSVELLAMDACLMGSIEVSYQFRPDSGGFSSKILVASPANEWGKGFDYDKIFSRLNKDEKMLDKVDNVTGDGKVKERVFDPYKMNAAEFAGIIIESQYDTALKVDSSQTMSVYNLQKAGNVKLSFDALAKALKDYKPEAVSIRETSDRIIYFERYVSSNWKQFPFFDIYDLTEQFMRIGVSYGNQNLVNAASSCLKEVDDFVLFSFAGEYVNYQNFKPGQNGVYVLFPRQEDWEYFFWYSPYDISQIYGKDYPYGKLLWCADGAVSGNNSIENWFELLHAWFDNGGINSYKY